MNIWLEDFKQNLLIAGFRNVKITDVNTLFKSIKNKTDNATVQLLDGSLVAGVEHLRFAALNALNAFKSKANISSSLAMETLLYASAQRQITQAVKLIGIKTDTKKVAVLVLAETESQASKILMAVSKLLGGRRDDSIIDLTNDKIARLKEFFGISSVELEAEARRKGEERQALTELVIEHMALLITQR